MKIAIKSLLMLALVSVWATPVFAGDQVDQSNVGGMEMAMNDTGQQLADNSQMGNNTPGTGTADNQMNPPADNSQMGSGMQPMPAPADNNANPNDSDDASPDTATGDDDY